MLSLGHTHLTHDCRLISDHSTRLYYAPTPQTKPANHQGSYIMILGSASVSAKSGATRRSLFTTPKPATEGSVLLRHRRRRRFGWARGRFLATEPHHNERWAPVSFTGIWQPTGSVQLVFVLRKQTDVSNKQGFRVKLTMPAAYL